MTIRFARRALEDIDRILDYLGTRSPTAQVNVGRAIFGTIDLIAEFPGRGRLSGQQDTHVTQAGRYPYLIYWYVEQPDIWIVHIRHAARRPWRGDDD